MWVLNAPFRKSAIEDVKGGTRSALQTGTGKQTLARSLKREEKTLIMRKRCVAQGCNLQLKGNVSVDERASSTDDVTSGMVDLSIDSEKGVISI